MALLQWIAIKQKQSTKLFILDITLCVKMMVIGLKMIISILG